MMRFFSIPLILRQPSTPLRKQVAGSILTRVLTFPVQLLSASLVSFLTIRFAGSDTFAVVGIAVSLQTFFAFINLGTNAPLASVSGSIAGSSASDEFYRVAGSAFRVTSLMGLMCVCVALAISIVGAWPILLGSQVPPTVASWGSLVVVAGAAVTQLLSLGVVILTNSGRAIYAVAITSSASVFGLLATLFVVIVRLGPVAYIAAVVAGPLIANMVGTICVFRFLRLKAKRIIARSQSAEDRRRQIFAESFPALIMWISLPLAYQSDRIILSHRSSVDEIARYNLAGQFYTPLFTLIGVSSAMLWGHYAAARQAHKLPTRRSFLRISGAYGLFGTILGTGFCLMTPPLGELISDGKVTLPFSLCVAFALLLIIQGFHQPSGMLQTDARGLTWNAVFVVAMTVANLAWSWQLAPTLGALGPVVASVVSVLTLLVLPSLLRALRQLAPTRSANWERP